MEYSGCHGKISNFIFDPFTYAAYIRLKCGILYGGNGGALVLEDARIVILGIRIRSSG